MPFLLVALAIVLVAVVAMVGIGVVRGGLADPPVNRPDHELPPGRLTPADLAGARFSLALRGYRMDEVDAVMDRMLAELRDSQAELARLRLLVGGDGPDGDER
ncbi:MAG: DivIVA domain-containing protein [Actinomycetales bacterium]